MLFVLKVKDFHYTHKGKFRENKKKIFKLVKWFGILLLCIFSFGVLLMLLYTPNLFFMAVPVQLFIIYGFYLLIKTSKLVEAIYAPSVAKHYLKENIPELVNYLNNTNDYYNPNISLEHVSHSTGVGIHEISRYINEIKGMSFNDFINQKRVEESQKRLNDPAYQHLSLEGIGNSVGFSSKSTFYRAFKKFEDKTPGEFKKSHSV